MLVPVPNSWSEYVFANFCFFNVSENTIYRIQMLSSSSICAQTIRLICFDILCISLLAKVQMSAICWCIYVSVHDELSFRECCFNTLALRASPAATRLAVGRRLRVRGRSELVGIFQWEGRLRFLLSEKLAAEVCLTIRVRWVYFVPRYKYLTKLTFWMWSPVEA